MPGHLQNLGALPDPIDNRDFRAAAVMGTPTVDFSKPFSVSPEPIYESQDIADDCVAESVSYYHEQLKPNKRFSRRDLFVRIALTYGAYIRDGILEVVKAGQATKDEVPDPDNRTPQNMRDKTGITPEKQADDKALAGFRIEATDIVSCAVAIRDYQGVVFGVYLSNEGWNDLSNPRPP